MDDFDSTKLFIFLLIQIWECALNLFIVELLHECLLDICHLYSLGATYLAQHVRVIIPPASLIHDTIYLTDTQAWLMFLNE